MKTGHRSYLAGMVLFELVIALSIFALVAFSLVMALNVAMDAAKQRNEIMAAIIGLQNQIAQVQAARVGPTEMDLPNDGSGITYHLKIEPEQMQDQKHQPLSAMYRATVTAKWTSGGQTEERNISELLYQP